MADHGLEIGRSISNALPTRPPELFSFRHKLFRLLWSCVWLVLARWTPPVMAPWRRLVLIAFGARMAARADVRGGANVWYPPYLTMEEDTLIAQGSDCYCQAQVTLRRGAIVSQGVFLCTGSHDVSDPGFRHVVRSIEVGENAWIAADAFVGPGVTVGTGAVLGARAVAFRDLEPWHIYVGNPAAAIRERSLP